MNAARYRFSPSEFDRLVDLQFFGEKRVELINGDLICQVGPSQAHIAIVHRLAESFIMAIASVPDQERTVVLRVCHPLALGASRPEPDLALVPDTFAPPTSASLLVEVSDVSLNFDTTVKADLYAYHGIPIFWVVDIKERVIWVYSEPSSRGYQVKECLEEGASIDATYVPCRLRVDEVFS